MGGVIIESNEIKEAHKYVEGHRYIVNTDSMQVIGEFK